MDNEAERAYRIACDAVAHNGGSVKLNLLGKGVVHIWVSINGNRARWALNPTEPNPVGLVGVSSWDVDSLLDLANPTADDGDKNLPWTY